jgi:hypothetical protein
MAMGMDKARDYGLVLYDINATELAKPSSNRPQSDLCKIVTQFGSGESVSSLLFLGNSSSPLLVAAMASKWIRVRAVCSGLVSLTLCLQAYDSRFRASSSGSAASATQLIFNARSAASLSSSLLDDNLFSATEDTTVRIFDIRKTSDAVLSLALNDFLPPDRKTSSIISTTWSPHNRGQLVTVDAAGSALSRSIYEQANTQQHQEPEYSLLCSTSGKLHLALTQ